MSDPSFWYGPWVTSCGIKGSFAFESLWVRHTSQCNTYSCISFVMPGQNMLSFPRSSVFVTPKCPVWTCFNISARSDLGMTIFWPLNIRTSSNDNSLRWFQNSRTDGWLTRRSCFRPTLNYCFLQGLHLPIIQDCLLDSFQPFVWWTKSCCKTTCTCTSRPAE